MSTEIDRPAPPRGPAPPHRVELLSGMYLFGAPDGEGGVREKIVSSAALVEAVTGITLDSGWLPPDVRRWGTSGRNGDWAVMFVPPARHTIELVAPAATPDAPVVSERITVPLPGVVLFGVGAKYYVWAVKTADLQPHHEVYRCPLPNVEPDAAICYGGHRPPRCTATSVRQAWDVFMRTPFNNHRCDGKSKRSPDDVRALLRELATAGGDGGASYPVDDLVRQVAGTGVTLDQALRKFFEDGGGDMPD